jgi:hypothetical protein
MTWFRHRGDTKFCTGAPSAGSFADPLSRPMAARRRSRTGSSSDTRTRRPRIAAALRCALARDRAERAEVNAFADDHLRARGDPLARGRDLTPSSTLAPTRARSERLRAELEASARTSCVPRAARARDAQDPLGTKYGAALVEAIDVAQSAGSPRLLSTREQDRLRELAKVVPQ